MGFPYEYTFVILLIIYISMSYTSAPIIDLLIQIKNAYMARKYHLWNIVASKFKTKVCELLKKSKFIKQYDIVTEGNKKTLVIDLIDSTNMNEVVPEIKIYSKPSRKYYLGREDIKWVAGWRGIGLISTDKGLMFTHEAKALKVWWELIAEIY